MQIIINVPSGHEEQITEAIANTYGVEPTVTGVRQHILQHLRTTVLNHARQEAVDQVTIDLTFGPDWDDLEVTLPDVAQGPPSS